MPRFLNFLTAKRALCDHSVKAWSSLICKYVWFHAGVSPSSDQIRKYEHTNTFGLIASPTSNVIWASKSTATEPTQRSSDVGIAIVGANEEVICWDLRKSELIGRWRDATNIAEVTVITPNPIEQDVYAVG